MTNTDEVIDVLEQLIETCRDGENGYRQAAEHAKDPELASFFRTQSTQRATFARELEAEAQRLGKSEPKGSGSVSGAVHRAWIDVKEKLGGGDTTILESVEQGEDNAKKNYEEALTKDLPENLSGLIRRQAQAVFSAHDRARTLRDARKAA
jgi:uncharacterized protein (TIGR02284 family)